MITCVTAGQAHAGRSLVGSCCVLRSRWVLAIFSFVMLLDEVVRLCLASLSVLIGVHMHLIMDLSQLSFVRFFNGTLTRHLVSRMATSLQSGNLPAWDSVALFRHWVIAAEELSKAEAACRLNLALVSDLVCTVISNHDTFIRDQICRVLLRIRSVCRWESANLSGETRSL